MYEAKTDRTEGKIDSCIILLGDFNTSLLVLDRKSKQKISLKNRGLEQHSKPTRSNRHIQHPLCNNNGINIILKCIWDIPSKYIPNIRP